MSLFRSVFSRPDLFFLSDDLYESRTSGASKRAVQTPTNMAVNSEMYLDLPV